MRRELRLVHAHRHVGVRDSPAEVVVRLNRDLPRRRRRGRLCEPLLVLGVSTVTLNSGSLYSSSRNSRAVPISSSPRSKKTDVHRAQRHLSVTVSSPQALPNALSSISASLSVALRASVILYLSLRCAGVS